MRKHPGKELFSRALSEVDPVFFFPPRSVSVHLQCPGGSWREWSLSTSPCPIFPLSKPHVGLISGWLGHGTAHARANAGVGCAGKDPQVHPCLSQTFSGSGSGCVPSCRPWLCGQQLCSDLFGS